VAEIAAQLTTTPAAVAGLLYRGLKALRARLGEDEDSPCPQTGPTATSG
jgi:hypothetical protein